MHLMTCTINGGTSVLAETAEGLTRTGFDDMLDIIDGGAEALATAHDHSRLAVSRGDFVAADRVLAPIPRPPRMLFAGLNYRDHLVESGTDQVPESPLIFAKTWNTVIGPGDPIVLDSRERDADYEVELGVVVGRGLAKATPKECLDSVFGYTVVNDVSSRRVQLADTQLTLGKNFDTYCPMGPAIVTADEVPDPMNLELTCTLNGRVMQRASTAEMLMGVAELLAFLSDHTRLHPGDVIGTGTPAGVGCYRNPPVYLAPGDVVEVAVAGVGKMSNPVQGL